jgi:hypothetical protein
LRIAARHNNTTGRAASLHHQQVTSKRLQSAHCMCASSAWPSCAGGCLRIAAQNNNSTGRVTSPQPVATEQQQQAIQCNPSCSLHVCQQWLTQLLQWVLAQCSTKQQQHRPCSKPMTAAAAAAAAAPGHWLGQPHPSCSLHACQQCLPQLH